MLHNKARIDSCRYTLKGQGLSQSSIDFCISWGEKYAEHQATPLEARILALEAEVQRQGNILYWIQVGDDITNHDYNHVCEWAEKHKDIGHPLLVGREVGL